ncbi:ABC transporter permease [Roseibium aggregatum]|uniref:ABC transporter permease n=1 Tax=Roseibium aggregatum TaxID=187304 RepID=UPI001AD8F554|nr:ABC transporter permease [Roseibium aggregatum]
MNGRNRTSALTGIHGILIKRLGALAVVLFGVSVLTFSLYYLSPGDKALAIAHARYMGEGNAPPEVVQAIREKYALNEPFLTQFKLWVSGYLKGDFGQSLVSGVPVWEIFLPNLRETLALACSALLIGLPLAFFLSLVSLWRPGSLYDRIAVAVASIGAAVPSYWLGLMLILVFAAWLNWLPSFGTGTPAHLILPAATLAVWITASQTRLFRSFLLEASSSPFLEALRLRGVGEKEIFWRHILRHAMVPAITMIGLDLAYLLEGAVIVEVIFARGGIGSLLVGSVMSRDYPIVLFLVMFSAFSYVAINSLIEALQDCLDPRKSLPAPSLRAQRPITTASATDSPDNTTGDR